jgi:cyanophycinase
MQTHKRPGTKRSNGQQNGVHAATRQNGGKRVRTRERTLIIIGGHEDKTGDKQILREVARRVGSGKLVVSTVASSEPEGIFEEYEKVFHDLGVRHLEKLEINHRAEATTEESRKKVAGAAGFFFTGGDQLKITSQIGDTPVYQELRNLHRRGAVIAGTSAGASVVCDTMLVGGEARESHRISDALHMAPGLGFIRSMIIDQHFAERGRLGRLLGAVAQNPKTLGVGIDEDTAIVVHDAQRFTVLGSGAVYVVDARHVTYSNLIEARAEETLAIHNLKMHVLSNGDGFDLTSREPKTDSAGK